MNGVRTTCLSCPATDMSSRRPCRPSWRFRTRQWRTLTSLFLSLVACDAALACWDEAARKYNVSAQLLYAIAKTESGLQARAINRANNNGTYDVGLMQINSSWLPRLARFGISENDLYEPCISIQVGAWILAENIRTHGMTWAAIGAYNTPNPVRGLAYARRVYANLPPELRGAWSAE